MTFDPTHAADVALPSACLLVAELVPHATGPARAELIRRATELLTSALLAYCEFRPAFAAPTPSRN